MNSNKTPIGAEAHVKWEDEDPNQWAHWYYISFGTEVEDENGEVISDSFGVNDDFIFFYGSPKDEQEYRDGVHGWTLLEWEFVYEDEVVNA